MSIRYDDQRRQTYRFLLEKVCMYQDILTINSICLTLRITEPSLNE
jgi:hypothetical protein